MLYNAATFVRIEVPPIGRRRAHVQQLQRVFADISRRQLKNFLARPSSPTEAHAASRKTPTRCRSTIFRKPWKRTSRSTRQRASTKAAWACAAMRCARYARCSTIRCTTACRRSKSERSFRGRCGDAPSCSIWTSRRR